MMDFNGQPLIRHYGTVIAHQLGYTETFGDGFEPPGKPTLQKGNLYVPSIFIFDTHVKVFVPKSRVDLYMTDDPLSGDAMIHAHMAGEPWDDEVFMPLCRRLADLPYGSQVLDALFAEAEFLDEHPEYRGLPGVARRHLSPSQIEVPLKPREKIEGVWERA